MQRHIDMGLRRIHPRRWNSVYRRDVLTRIFHFTIVKSAPLFQVITRLLQEATFSTALR